MLTKSNLATPQVGRIAPLLVGAVAMVIGGCVGPHRTAWSVKPVNTPSTGAVDIQRLIDEAEDGGLVRVPAGRYVLLDGLVVMNRKGLRIVFDEGAAVLVEDVTRNVVSIIESERISIENAKLAHRKPLKAYECHGNVLDIRDSRHVRILECDINGCGAVGVLAWDSEGVVVAGCHIHRNTFNAFYLQGCRGVRIERNVIVHNANLMQAYDVDDLEMDHNIIRDNGGYWDDIESDSESSLP